MDIVKNSLFLISLSGDIEYNELQNDFRVTIGSLSYVFTINVLPYGGIDISFSDKIKLYVTENKSMDSLCVDIESYYSGKRRSSTDPPLRFIRKMLQHFKCITLDDMSNILCDDAKIPYRLMPFIKYRRLHLYEGIVDTPDIAFDIREILEKNNKLIENMCDITVEKLKNQLEFLLIESKNPTYRKKYSRALKVIADDIPHILSHIADILFSYKRSKKGGMIFCSSRKPPLPPLERDDILREPMGNNNHISQKYQEKYKDACNNWGSRHSDYGYRDAYTYLKKSIEHKNLDGIDINAKIIYKNFVGRDEFFDYVEEQENKIKIAIEQEKAANKPWYNIFSS